MYFNLCILEPFLLIASYNFLLVGCIIDSNSRYIEIHGFLHVIIAIKGPTNSEAESINYDRF